MRLSRQLGQRGFTIIELAIVALIIGILATLALPAFRRLMLRSQASAVCNDLRVFRDGFRLYLAENGKWPAAQGGADFPAGMEGFLRETSWTRRTPIGGRYQWDRDGGEGSQSFRAAIRIRSAGGEPVTTNYEQLLVIDSQFDDGNLFTGALQVDAYPQLLLIIE